MAKNSNHLLRKACRHWGVQVSYLKAPNLAVTAPEKTLRKVLADLSRRPTTTDADLLALIELRKSQKFMAGVEPTCVQWLGKKSQVRCYFSSAELTKPIKVRVGETGEEWESKISGEKFWLTLPPMKTSGYFNIEIKTQTRILKTLLICAPEKIKSPPDLQRSWGAFLPLYALTDAKDWGMGSITQLQHASLELKKYGAKWVGCLPMLAGNFEPKDCDPSPYSALTRLFWNEIYLDVDRLVSESQSTQAKVLLNSPKTVQTIEKLRQEKYVDYHQVYHLKKPILQILSAEFFSNKQDESGSYKLFLNSFLDLEEYVKFRSSNPEEQNFHRYVQYQMHLALLKLHQENPLKLYMDFPVGVNDAGYDFHKYPKLFFAEVSVGAPPEPVFQKGQDWGFPAFHPDELRRDQYQYLRKSFANHLRYCSILRLDHVMGLHRVYVVPKGFAGTEGVYLRFKPEEMFAIACLEADQAGADIIGENLGTVPDVVNDILVEREFKSMTVGQFLFVEPPQSFETVIPTGTLLCMNTHDMPQFSAFLTGEDLDQVAKLGILDKSYLEELKTQRAQALNQWRSFYHDQDLETLPLYRKLLQSMAKSKAQYLIINLEDLWGENEPQNIPGTYREVPNWRKKFKLKIEAWSNDQDTKSALDILREFR